MKKTLRPNASITLKSFRLIDLAALAVIGGVCYLLVIRFVGFVPLRLVMTRVGTYVLFRAWLEATARLPPLFFEYSYRAWRNPSVWLVEGDPKPLSVNRGWREDAAD